MPRQELPVTAPRHPHRHAQHEEGQEELRAQIEEALRIIRLAEYLGPRPAKPRVRVHLN